MKKITDSDFDKIRQDLYRQGFKKSERDKAEMVFLGDKDEGRITQKEADKTLKYMEKNKGKYGFSGEKIEKLKDEIRRRMH